jgi:glycine dehydrogenase subunit 2
MTMNTVGRPTSIDATHETQVQTISGDRGLDHEEPLLFELGRKGMCGVDIPRVDISDARLNG